MNISSGCAKGKQIIAPISTKPIKSIVKESIFSTLGTAIKNKRCLDLFAGSGMLGLEAISRGAKSCVFVDSAKEAVDCILQNIRNCAFSDKAIVERSDAIKFVLSYEERYDFIFLDPPYKDPTTHILKIIYELASKNCVLIYPHDTEKTDTDIANFTKAKSRKFGKTEISYYTIDK